MSELDDVPNRRMETLGGGVPPQAQTGSKRPALSAQSDGNVMLRDLF